MGTCIVAYAEYLAEDTGLWTPLGELGEDEEHRNPGMKRNYPFFSWLGCDLGDTPPGPLANRGWPDDSSYDVEFDEGNTNHTYFEVRELDALEGPFVEILRSMLEDPTVTCVNLQSVRILISFNS